MDLRARARALTVMERSSSGHCRGDVTDSIHRREKESERERVTWPPALLATRVLAIWTRMLSASSRSHSMCLCVRARARRRVKSELTAPDYDCVRVCECKESLAALLARPTERATLFVWFVCRPQIKL